jgi:8-oxo-dGTP pyrophosphatase MutT (NUDIX family)
MLATSTESRHLTASMVVIDPANAQVLLAFHKGMGRLVFPGGHVDPDESPDETALREVFEETGIHARLTGQIPLDLPGMTWRPQPWIVAEIPAPAYEATEQWPAEPEHSHIDMLYIGVADSTAPLTAQLDEVDSVGWYPVGQLTGIGARDEVPAVAYEAYRIARDGIPAIALDAYRIARAAHAAADVPDA